MNFWRVHCSCCGKSFAPLQRFIHLDRYQTKTNELEKLIVETVSETSYRRGVVQLARDGKAKIPYHTAHDWVLATDCDEIEISPQTVGSLPVQIMPDGTGFKGEGKNGDARKGDLKVVIGITQSGEIFPLGAKAGVSWDEISKQWKENEMKLPTGHRLFREPFDESGVVSGAAERLPDFAKQGECIAVGSDETHGHVCDGVFLSVHLSLPFPPGQPTPGKFRSPRRTASSSASAALR